MAPSIKIIGHKHQSVRTVVNAVGADGLQVTEHEDFTIERVWATFEITGADPVLKTRRSTTAIQPETLKICFQSRDGGKWTRSGSSDVTVDGRNVKKGGELGAEATILFYDLPPELAALYSTGTYGVEDAGPAFEWIRKMMATEKANFFTAHDPDAFKAMKKAPEFYD